jgi:hypothetical protein
MLAMACTNTAQQLPSPDAGLAADAPAFTVPPVPDAAPDGPRPDLPPLPDLPPSDAFTADPCSLPAETGPCDGAFMRFHYRPSTARCEPFSYGGCMGNANNFATKAECDIACAHRADACRRCTSQNIGATCESPSDCSLCPVTRAFTGQVCPVAGFNCVWGPSCGAIICDCMADAAGALRWACASTLCR